MAWLFATHLAHAASKWQGTLSGAAGYTDNAFSSPDDADRERVIRELELLGREDPRSLIPPREPDALIIASPGVEFAYLDSAALHRVGYTFTGILFVDHSEANAFSNLIEWESVFDLTPRVNLILGASALQEHQHTVNTFTNASATAVRALFPGTGRSILARFEQGLDLDLSHSWRARQTSTAALSSAVFEESSISFENTNRVGVDYLWIRDALGPELRFEYAHITDATDVEGRPLGDQRHIITGAALVWRHDWGRYFTSRLEAGGVQVDWLDRDARYRSPVGRAALGYVREEGLAELSYAHAVSTDLYLGQVFVVDEVRIHGSIPLDADDRFWLGSTLGYQAGRVLDEVGNPAADVDVIVGDVALAWQFEDELRFSVRYQHIEQMTDADALPPLPLSFVRNSVMFGATLELPREQDMPRRYRRSERVDESDEVRDELEENPASTAPGL